MEYEHKKFSGELPIMGVNTFKDPNHLDSSADSNNQPIELIRSTDEEKDGQVEQVNYLKKLYSQEQKQALINLKTKALNNQNIFEELLETTKMCTLGMISDALYEVGGAYRRSM